MRLDSLPAAYRYAPGPQGSRDRSLQRCFGGLDEAERMKRLPSSAQLA